MRASAGQSYCGSHTAGCRVRSLGRRPREVLARAGEGPNSLDELLRAMWGFGVEESEEVETSSEGKPVEQLPLEYYVDAHYWTHGVS